MAIVSFDPPSVMASDAEWDRFSASIRSAAKKLSKADAKELLYQLDRAIKSRSGIEGINFK